MAKIKVTLHKDGTQKIEVLNASGEDCVKLTAPLERRLGGQVGEREFKPEYHEREAVVETDREHEG